MRDTSRIIFHLFIFKLSIIAQGIVVETSNTPDVENQINTALSALSMSPVTSGVLIDRTLPLVDLADYGASAVADSVWIRAASKN